LGWAADVLEVADAVGADRFSVIGLGSGGPHAMACAYQLPKLAAGRLVNCGLVSSDGPYQADDIPEGVRGASRSLVPGVC